MRARLVMAALAMAVLAAPPARADGLRAQIGTQIGDLGQKVRKAVDTGRPLRQREANAALRETLHLSIAGATASLAEPGSFSDTDLRIGLPDPIGAFQGRWNAAGRSGALERLEDAMNVAAEQASGMALAPMIDAANEIDFYDAVAIVRSGDTAASQFYALRAREKLDVRLAPLVEAQLNHAGAFEALKEATVAGGAEDRFDSLRRKVLERTLDGMITALLDAMMAEERAIRADPEAYGSPLLSDVFAAHSGG